MRIVQQGPQAVLETCLQMPAELSRVQRGAIAQIFADHQDRRAALVLEQLRLAARYGPRSYEAKLAQAKIDRLDIAGAALALEASRATIVAPQPDPKAFVIYGRVLDRKGKPIPKTEVIAVDSKEAVPSGAETDDSGVFSFKVRPDQAEQIRLRVSHDGRQNALSDTETLQVNAGSVAYREFIIK